MSLDKAPIDHSDLTLLGTSSEQVVKIVHAELIRLLGGETLKIIYASHPPTVVLTKLDGSAKGGIVFAIETELGIPVKLVGLGETVSDLAPFVPGEFVDALFEG
jgi:signal recognition particle GTPase